MRGALKPWIKYRFANKKKVVQKMRPENARPVKNFSHLGSVLTHQHCYFHSRVKTLQLDNPIISYSHNYTEIVAIEGEVTSLLL